MVRVPIVQKLISKEREILSCSESIKITDLETGEVICKNCGQVLVQNMVDHSYNGLIDDFKNPRTGPKMSMIMHYGGLSTVIGKSNFDSSGKAVSYAMKSSLKRMRLWDSRSKATNSSQRNLMVALLEINKLKDKCHYQMQLLKDLHIFTEKHLKKN